MKCDNCGAPVENGRCTQCGKLFPAVPPGMVPCKTCGTLLAKTAKRCPGCGAKIKKPFYKKWWVWAIVAVVLIGAIGGGGGSKKEITDVEGGEGGSKKEIVNQNDTETVLESEKESETKAVSDETTVQEQVLFDHEGVVITAKEYETDLIWGDKLNILIENTSDNSVGVGCSALIVNNYMISDLFSETVAAGKKVNTSIHLYSSELEAAGIENVGQIEIVFHLFDPDSYMTTYTADMVTVKTSDYETMDTTPNDAGKELYNEGGIRIVGKYVDEASFWGAAVLLYMENNSGKNITVSCEDLSVNGYMVTSFLYTEIYDGKMAIDDINLLSSDLEENGIDSVDEVELVFHFIDPENWMDTKESDPITFSAK